MFIKHLQGLFRGGGNGIIAKTQLKPLKSQI